MYLQNESKIEPFEPDPSEKIHFFQNRYMFCTKKCEMSLMYVLVAIEAILRKREFSHLDPVQMVQS